MMDLYVRAVKDLHAVEDGDVLAMLDAETPTVEPDYEIDPVMRSGTTCTASRENIMNDIQEVISNTVFNGKPIYATQPA